MVAYPAHVRKALDLCQSGTRTRPPMEVLLIMYTGNGQIIFTDHNHEELFRLRKPTPKDPLPCRRFPALVPELR